MKITKTNNINKKIVRGILLGSLIGIAAEVLLTLLIALIVEKSGKLPYNLTDFISVSICAAGAFAGGYSAARIIRSNGLIIGAVVGFVMFAVIFAAGLIIGAGELSLFSLYKLAALEAASVVGGILGVNKKVKVKYK